MVADAHDSVQLGCANAENYSAGLAGSSIEEMLGFCHFSESSRERPSPRGKCCATHGSVDGIEDVQTMRA
jgi:hypothetical protein